MQRQDIIIIIPARYGSTRFPGKPLELLGGKPIIGHVLAQAMKLGVRCVVATDDERIARVVEELGDEAVLTGSDHPSGTDRVAEAYKLIGQPHERIVVNLQGDEPFVRPEQIERLIEAFDDEATEIATLAEVFAPDTPDSELANPNIVKLVCSPSGLAHYFSRNPIPHLRGIEGQWCRHHRYYRHIGLYAFRADVLGTLSQLTTSPLEQAERLEQLRWLEAGYRIRVMETTTATIGIDTPEDLVRAEAWLRAKGITQDI